MYTTYYKVDTLNNSDEILYQTVNRFSPLVVE